MVVRSETPRRCAGDEGAALVEAAFVSPILLFLLIGILEAGLLFRTYLAIGSGTQDGARSASILGDDQYADFEIIKDVQRALTVIPQGQIVNLVVFKAAGPNSSVPTTCRDSTVRMQDQVNLCNTYTPLTDWSQPDANKTMYNCGTPGLSKGYCPTGRKTALTGANSPPDYIGITITVNHRYVSKLFGSSKPLSATTISRLEPQTLQ